MSPLKRHPAQFIIAVQQRCARIAVSASATRRQGKGTVKAARKFLKDLPLRQYGTKDARKFRARIDKATNALEHALPSRSRSWGLARKLLNIFLRDAMYTTYLRDHFKLDLAEAYLEIPLDSIVAKSLKAMLPRGALPVWRGVRNVTPKESEAFQKQASEIARKERITRVQLDTYWWGGRDQRRHIAIAEVRNSSTVRSFSPFSSQIQNTPASLKN
jgi:hypothetical protein